MSRIVAAEHTVRVFDTCAVLVGLAVLSPLFLLAALLVKLTSHGPIFHRANRVGKDGQLFRLYKFRTMVVNADQVGPGITTADDPRTTRVGRLLRRTKIDELPQLLNVLKGDMSLVGPRPEDPRYIDYYTPVQRQVLRVRPGVTSPASLRYCHEEQLLHGPDWERTYVEQILPEKLAIELAYLSKRTLLSDVTVLVHTLLTLLHTREATRPI